jgi:gamma-D-glutamyl-L-lysine dipeptidyl-peptidase
MALFHERLARRIDARLIGCEVSVQLRGHRVQVSGFTMYPHTDTFVRSLAAEVFGEDRLDVELLILTRDVPLAFHEVAVPSAPVGRHPGVVPLGVDLLTEVLYGNVIRTFFHADGYLYAQSRDGYLGYVPASALRPANVQEYLRWKNGKCMLLRRSVPVDGIVVPPTVRLVHRDGQVRLPGGQWTRLPASSCSAIKPGRRPFLRSLLRHARSYESARYLWGGTTGTGIDCSGLTQSLMFQEGIILPRDANMQASVGEIVGYLPEGGDLLPGDLLFFMRPTAFIYHVAVCLGRGEFIHATPRGGGVARNSLWHGAPNYSPTLRENFVFGRRLKVS